MDYFKKCPKCGRHMTYTGGGASDRTVYWKSKWQKYGE